MARTPRLAVYHRQAGHKGTTNTTMTNVRKRRGLPTAKLDAGSRVRTQASRPKPTTTVNKNYYNYVKKSRPLHLGRRKTSRDVRSSSPSSDSRVQRKKKVNNQTIPMYTSHAQFFIFTNKIYSIYVYVSMVLVCTSAGAVAVLGLRFHTVSHGGIQLNGQEQAGLPLSCNRKEHKNQTKNLRKVNKFKSKSFANSFHSKLSFKIRISSYNFTKKSSISKGFHKFNRRNKCSSLIGRKSPKVGNVNKPKKCWSLIGPNFTKPLLVTPASSKSKQTKRNFQSKRLENARIVILKVKFYRKLLQNLTFLCRAVVVEETQRNCHV